MSGRPRVGPGRVRLREIAGPDAKIDLQPCGGTHIRNTAEIGPVAIGKIENKGRQNRRINIPFAEECDAPYPPPGAGHGPGAPPPPPRPPTAAAPHPPPTPPAHPHT